MPSHASREVLILFGSLTTCDPGDILQTTKVRPLGLLSWYPIFNSLSPGRCGFRFKYVILKCTMVIIFIGISSAIAIRGMPQDPTDYKSILVQVMAWCCQATSHYLGRSWLRYASPYGFTRLQWVKSSHCNSFEYHVPLDFIYWCLVFKLVAG